MPAGHVDVPPEMLKLVRIGHAGRAVRGRENLHGLAAVFRDERSVGANARAFDQIRMTAGGRRAIEIVRRSVRMETRGFYLHRGLGQQDLKSRRLALLRV